MIARQLTLEDCQAVADLETQLFDGRFDAADLRALLGKPAFYGAVLPAADKPTTIHAYCLAYITSMQADIIAIGTDKTKQGRGFGRIILQHLIDVTEQQNVAEITLEVAADNMPARRLYDSCGFHVSGVRKNYYYRGENRCDAVIMVRQCDSAFP
ncbi:MAG: alanine acetyltransferase [Alphaproteobacteria bacterium]|nr:MAG: alanine acetyltransferase [Alphaproteobacteria bacterium]